MTDKVRTLFCEARLAIILAIHPFSNSSCALTRSSISVKTEAPTTCAVISFDFITCGKVHPKIALKILKKEIQHDRVVTKIFDRSNVSLYDDIYSTPGQKKYYVVNDVLESFTSKVGQFVEVMNLEEFGNALFIDHEIQVAEKDEKIYSSNFFKSSYDLSKKNNNVAIIGGGDGGVARACLDCLLYTSPSPRDGLLSRMPSSA